jgi:hypothetical protein
MTERDPHPDNDLIDSMAKDAGGSTTQNDRAGGNLARDVGTRAEERTTEGNLSGEEVDRVKGSDNPEQDALKGDKTIAAMPTTPER